MHSPSALEWMTEAGGIKTLGLDRYERVIGDNVSVGAMSFVNKDIPPGTTFYNAR